MQQPTTIGIDLAKSVFQVHGVDADGAVVVKRKLRRAQVLTIFAGLEPCLVGMEACAGAHFWARELQALRHEVRIMPPSYVKPYVKREDRCGRCRGDLRGGHTAHDAVRAGEVGGGEAPNGSASGPQDAFARSLGRIAFAGSPSSASARSW